MPGIPQGHLPLGDVVPIQEPLGDRRNEIISHGTEGRHTSERGKGCFGVLIGFKSFAADGGFLTGGSKGDIPGRPQADRGRLLSPAFAPLVDEHPQPL